MSTIVVAYSGGIASSLAVRWLASHHPTDDVVTVTVDVGQGDDLSALRWRALSCGAVRAHAIDARDELARAYLSQSLPAGTSGVAAARSIADLTRPLIARTLVEVARIEGAAVVAHGADDAALDDCIRAIDPSIAILAPAAEWGMDEGQLADYARAQRVPLHAAIGQRYTIDQNLWGRAVTWRDGEDAPDQAHLRALAPASEPARLDIEFERGVPVAVNGVPMSPVELVESLTLIAGRHGVGHQETGGEGRRIVYDAPAAVVLRTARAAADGPSGVVRLTVLEGECRVIDPQAFPGAESAGDAAHPSTELVRHA